MKRAISLIMAIVLMLSVMPTGVFSIIASAATDVYTITYHLDGGTNALKNPDVYTAKDTIVLMDANKVGYDFAGWYLNEDKTQQITQISGSGNIDIYAKFTAKTYAATFNGNGADECGYKITLLNDKTGEEKYVYLNSGDSFSPHEYWKPSAYGYVYAGWMYESEVISGTLKINSDIVLVPKWIDNPNHYPVLGDDSSAIFAQIYYEGDTRKEQYKRFYTSYEYKDFYYSYVLQEYKDPFTKYDTPTAYSECTIEKNGYEIVYHAAYTYFGPDGWQLEWGSGSFSATAGDLFLAYVKARGSDRDDVRYTNVYIRIEPANKRTDIGKIEVDNTVKFDSSFNAPGANKEGYTFLGWYDSQGNQIADTWQYTEDQTFSAKWELTKYDIIYHLDGGVNNAENPSSYTIEDTIALKDPAKPGYTFVGWYSDANFKTQVTAISNKAEDITLYAKWAVNSYNLTLDANNGGFAPKVTFISDGVKIKSYYLYGEDTITAYCPQDKEGYIFAGWYLDDTFTSLFKFNGTITDDIILYAKWIKCDRNIINIESAEKIHTTIQGKTAQLYAFVPLVDGQITVTSESNNLDMYGILYNSNYSVLTYNDDISDTDLDFIYTYNVKAGQLYYISVKGNTASTMGQAKINIFWTGDCIITGTTYQDRQFTVVYDTNFTLPQKPKREGYVFLGWFDENETQITEGIWNFDTDKTLTAKWEEATYHTVIFKDVNGNIISSETYYLTEDIVAPELPTKAPDNKYIYHAKWDNDYSGVCTGDAIYSPVFDKEYIEYTVIFKDEDGTVLSLASYHYGDEVTVPAEPTKEADNTYTYTFAGWDKDVVNCEGDATYTATYTPNYIDYTVVFKNWDGTILATYTYHYGDTIIPPVTPTKPSDNTYSYIFNGWDKELICNGDMTITAVYSSPYNEYTVTFKDWDGSVISSKTYHYGDKVTAPNNPTKTADNTFTYTFAGWDNTVVNCNGDAIYTATYTANYIEYTVIFKDEDGTVLSLASYHYGDEVTVPAEPTKEADNTYTYTFAGWDKDVVNCEGDATYTATYTPNYIDYTVVFKNWDGTILATYTYHYGDEVTVPAEPTKTADSTYTYIFAGWDKDVVDCDGDMTYTATYTAKYINYTVTFEDWDGTVLYTNTYHYGDIILFLGTPARPSDNTYSYDFNGWDKDVVDCEGDATYTATYTATYIDYTVIFKDENGTVLSSTTYHYGDAVIVPAEPTKAADNTYTYTFAGWDKDVVDCDGDMTYTATYTPNYIEYTVIFKDWDDAVLSTNTYHYGDSVIAPTEPTRSNDDKYFYAFAGWDKTVTDCDGDAVYTATYTATARVPDEITSSKYIIDDNNISKITIGTTAVELLSSLNEGEYCKVFKGDTEVSENAAVGTGMTVKIMDGDEEKATYTIIVKGDTNGDGKINSTDFMQVRKQYLGLFNMTEAQKAAADVNGDGKINSTDFMQIRKHFLGLYNMYA